MMLCDLIALMESPTTHACIWRDGELYIEPVAGQAGMDAGTNADCPVTA
jgi:hypothetical protein